MENQYSGDSIYLYPNGKPVTIKSLRLILSKQGKKIIPEYLPYNM